MIDPNSAAIVPGTTTELSRFGCFVQTTTPLARRSRIHIDIDDGVDIFSASGVVAYVTDEGMGIAFGIVEARNHKVLARWLASPASVRRGG